MMSSDINKVNILLVQNLFSSSDAGVDGLGDDDRPISLRVSTLDCVMLARFRRPIDTLQLAMLARALLAEAPTLGPAVRFRFGPIGGTCSDVVRRRLGSMFAKPSEAECVGEGVNDSPKGLLDLLSRSLSFALFVDEDTDDGVGGDVMCPSPDKAVVATAFDKLADPDDELVGNGGIRPPLKDSRDDELARDAGRNGECTIGECVFAICRVGEGGVCCISGDGVLFSYGGVEGIVSSCESAGFA